MRTNKLLLAIVALVITSSVSAQSLFLKNNTSSTEGVWTDYHISIDSPTLIDKEDDGDEEFNDFDGGYTVGYSIVQPIPGEKSLFLAYGAELSYAYKSTKNTFSNVENSNNIFNINVVIPVNIIYKCEINEAIALAPYFGVGARVGLLYTNKYKVTYDGETTSGATNLYSDNDTNGDPYNRFLLCYQYGLDVHIQNKYIVGVKWQKDILEICEGFKFKNGIAINLGVKL